jgi:predicted DNA-binding transcriptional regulator AlpA
MMDLPQITTIDSKFHLDVPFWLNGIFRTIFKTAKWNPHGNVFVTPATDQNLQKWNKFHGYAMTVAESLKKANLLPYSRVPVIYALTNINAFPLLGGFMSAARQVGWSEVEILEVTKLATSSHNGHLHWVLGVFCLEPSRRFRR